MTSSDYTDKWARRLSGATEDIRRGVEAVSKSPTEAAPAKIDKMKANWLKKVEDGTVAKNLRAVSLEDWKRKMIDQGVNRISGGVEGSKDKMSRFADKFLPYAYAVSDKVKSMPDLTLEDSISRMTTAVRELAKFRK